MSYDSTTYRLPDPNIDPLAPGFTTVALKENSAGTRSKLNTGGSISVSFGGSYWTLELSYPEATPEEEDFILPIISYISSSKRPVYVQHPKYINPKSGAWNVSTATARRDGAISMGNTANEIVVTGWGSRGGNLARGDMLKFTNSHKIYQVVAVTLDGTSARILLHCPVVEPSKLPTAGLYPNNIQFRMDLVEHSASELTLRGLHEPITLTFEENIR